MAAGLLQPGLFDRRAERAAAAQASVLTESLERCTLRLADLEACRTVAAADPALAFALLIC
jgi:hypothetical protein